MKLLLGVLSSTSQSRIHKAGLFEFGSMSLHRSKSCPPSLRPAVVRVEKQIKQILAVPSRALSQGVPLAGYRGVASPKKHLGISFNGGTRRRRWRKPPQTPLLPSLLPKSVNRALPPTALRPWPPRFALQLYLQGTCEGSSVSHGRVSSLQSVRPGIW